MISRTSSVAASCIFNPLTHLCILSCRQVHLLGLRGLTVYCSRTVVLVGRQLSELLGLADALRDGRIRERMPSNLRLGSVTKSFLSRGKRGATLVIMTVYEL